VDVVGVIVAAMLIARGWKDQNGVRQGRVPVAHVMDALALVAPFGFFLGRLANFVNGELLGKIVAAPGEPAPWWAVKFPQEVLTTQGPEGQKYQVVALMDKLGIGGATFESQYEDLLRMIQHHGASMLRIQLEPLISARYPSQLFQAVAEGLVLGAVLWVIARRPRLPGVIAAWFLICYGVLRVVTELWRLPDPQFAVGRPGGLSRGQWLSVGMVAVGAVGLVVAVRRGGRKLGGWAHPAAVEDPASPAARS
jgi:phosphatidylglycerol:prolipoprotein diacylglycerol transferase